MEIVNAFNRADGPLRLLLCSDVASEGLNLHHCSHRLVHFDIPWSLMVFQQRNGRVDRYGQTVAPEIHYLLSEAADPDVRGDQRVLEVLIEKDRVASRNLGDPSEFQFGDSVEAQEADTAALFERDGVAGTAAIDIDAILAGLGRDETDGVTSGHQHVMERFAPGRAPTGRADLPERTVTARGVYPDARAFLTAGLGWLAADAQLEWSGEYWYLAHGGFPNRRGQALIQDHVAVRFVDGVVTELLPLVDALDKLGIDGRALPNRQEPRDCAPLREHLPAVIEHLRGHLRRARADELARRRPALDAELERLEAQQQRHRQQLELELGASGDTQARKARKRAEREAAIDRHFHEYERWLRDSLETEEEPYMQILAVITGGSGTR